MPPFVTLANGVVLQNGYVMTSDGIDFSLHFDSMEQAEEYYFGEARRAAARAAEEAREASRVRKIPEGTSVQPIGNRYHGLRNGQWVPLWMAMGDELFYSYYFEGEQPRNAIRAEFNPDANTLLDDAIVLGAHLAAVGGIAYGTAAATGIIGAAPAAESGAALTDAVIAGGGEVGSGYASSAAALDTPVFAFDEAILQTSGAFESAAAEMPAMDFIAAETMPAAVVDAPVFAAEEATKASIFNLPEISAATVTKAAQAAIPFAKKLIDAEAKKDQAKIVQPLALPPGSMPLTAEELQRAEFWSRVKKFALPAGVILGSFLFN